jgi:hypothetical protein
LSCAKKDRTIRANLLSPNRATKKHKEHKVKNVRGWQMATKKHKRAQVKNVRGWEVATKKHKEHK